MRIDNLIQRKKTLYAPPVAYPYTRGGTEYEVSAASSRLCSAFSSFQRFLLVPGSLPVFSHSRVRYRSLESIIGLVSSLKRIRDAANSAG